MFNLILAAVPLFQHLLPVAVEGRTFRDVEINDIRDATTDRSGERLFVLDGREGRVLVFDKTGRHLGAFGRKGQGPGEITHASRLGWVSDTLWVLDAPARVHFFRVDGTLIRTVTSSLNPYGPTAAGGNLVRERVGSVNGPAIPGQGVRVPYTISHQIGSTSRKLAELDDIVRPLRVTIRVNGQVGTGYQNQPLRDDALAVADRDGRTIVIVIRGASREPPYAFRVLRLSLAGDTLLNRTVSYVPQPIDQGVIKYIIAEVYTPANLGGQRGLTVDPAEFERELYRPAHLPPVSGVVIGRDDTIWLKRELNSRARKERYQVLTVTGEMRGMVELPTGERLAEVQSGRIWTIAKDEDDVPFVKWYRLASR